MKTDVEALIRETFEWEAARAPVTPAQDSVTPAQDSMRMGASQRARSRGWGYVLGTTVVAAVILAAVFMRCLVDRSAPVASNEPKASGASSLCHDLAPKVGLGAEVLRSGEFDSPSLDQWLRTSPYGSERPLTSYSGIDPNAPTTILCVFTTDGYPTSGLAGRPDTGFVDGSRALAQSANAWSLAGVGPSEFFVRGFDDLQDRSR